MVGLGLLIGAAVIGSSAVTGMAGTASAICNNARARVGIGNAQVMYSNALDEADAQRQSTSKVLETLGETKVRVWSEDVGRFVRAFGHFANVNTDNHDFSTVLIKDEYTIADIEKITVNASDILAVGFASIGAGVLSGIAATGGATMFAAASTGTAISALSGIAASNALLAFFGGGALAAGGGGIALGSLMLGGIAVAPIFGVAGLVMGAQSRANLAKSNMEVRKAAQAVEELTTLTSFLESVSNLAVMYNNFIVRFCDYYRPHVKSVMAIYKDACAKQGVTPSKTAKGDVDYTKLSPEQQHEIHRTHLLTQVINGVMLQPLINDDGDIDGDAVKMLTSSNESAEALLPEECAKNG